MELIMEIWIAPALAIPAVSLGMRSVFHPSLFIQFGPLTETQSGKTRMWENIIYLLCNVINLHWVSKLFMSFTAKIFHALILSNPPPPPPPNSTPKSY